jgi:hypothetical protein
MICMLGYIMIRIYSDKASFVSFAMQANTYPSGCTISGEEGLLT